MSAHVDLVRNLWEKEVQERVALVRPEEDDVIVTVLAPDRNWDALVHRALAPVIPTVPTGGALLDRLADVLDNVYLFATEPHDDKSCPFSDSEVLPIEREEIREEFKLRG